MSVEYYEKKVSDMIETEGKDSNIVAYYEIMLDCAKTERENDEVVDFFNGNLKKAIALMKKLNDEYIDMDDDDPNRDKMIEKYVNKIKVKLNREETEISLKIKELQKRKDKLEIVKMYSSDSYTDATMWFYRIHDYVKNVKKREID